jgi:hypothetical protein
VQRLALAVDDNRNAWDVRDRRHVLHIQPASEPYRPPARRAAAPMHRIALHCLFSLCKRRLSFAMALCAVQDGVRGVLRAAGAQADCGEPAPRGRAPRASASKILRAPILQRQW